MDDSTVQIGRTTTHIGMIRAVRTKNIVHGLLGFTGIIGGAALGTLGVGVIITKVNMRKSDPTTDPGPSTGGAIMTIIGGAGSIRGLSNWPVAASTGPPPAVVPSFDEEGPRPDPVPRRNDPSGKSCMPDFSTTTSYVQRHPYIWRITGWLGRPIGGSALSDLLII